MTLPALLPFAGDWKIYEDQLYAIFMNEIAKGGLVFRGDKVSCRRLPETAGRWAAFWHLIQTGPVEDDRLPDLRRCERLRWVKYVIEAWNTDADIEWWENQRGSETNVLLWLREEYLVILAKRDGYWLLKSAYETDRPHRIRSLKTERDRFHGR
ncbi:hypothetical protein [Sphingomonas sp. DT-204]|uniref:hypothetical protein n=1 Tax=Sphingomonas sp. DT-204 TaxID=3396166 RepID=UPI003F19377D